jgi:hypothetical protein
MYSVKSILLRLNCAQVEAVPPALTDDHTHSPSSNCKAILSVGNLSPNCAGILEQSLGAKEPSMNRVVVPARQTTFRPAESIPWNQFLGSLKV